MAEEQVVDPVDDAASVGAEINPVGDAGAGVAKEQPFFTFKGKDGIETVFKNRGEVADHMTHSSMRREVLDAEMGKVSARGAHIEEQIKQYTARTKELEGSEGARYHEFLKKNPQVAAEIKAAMGQSGDSDLRRVVGEIVKPLIDKQTGYDKAEEGRAADGRRATARARMVENYPGFDESLIHSELKRIQDIPEEDLEYALYELMHNVVQGRSNPAELERRAAQAAARPTTPSVKSTPGVKTVGRNPNDMTAAEKRQAAEDLLPG